MADRRFNRQPQHKTVADKQKETTKTKSDILTGIKKLQALLETIRADKELTSDNKQKIKDIIASLNSNSSSFSGHNIRDIRNLIRNYSSEIQMLHESFDEQSKNSLATLIKSAKKQENNSNAQNHNEEQPTVLNSQEGQQRLTNALGEFNRAFPIISPEGQQLLANALGRILMNARQREEQNRTERRRAAISENAAETQSPQNISENVAETSQGSSADATAQQATSSPVIANEAVQSSAISENADQPQAIEDILNKNLDQLTSADMDRIQTLLEQTRLNYEQAAKARSLCDAYDAKLLQEKEEQRLAAEKAEADRKKAEEKVAREQEDRRIQETKAAEIALNTATPEEKEKLLKEVRSSHTPAGYMATISPKIQPHQIEASMKLNTAEERAKALANPDDLLVALDYYRRKNNNDAVQTAVDSFLSRDNTADIKEVIAARLKQYLNSPKNINPDNAYVLLYLADQIKDRTDLYNRITQKIADALKQYDNKNFGTTLTEQQLNDNYNRACEALKSFTPTTIKNGRTIYTLSQYTFTDDKGNRLCDKNRGWLNPNRYISGKGNNASRNEQAILNMARELAAQKLAKTGLAEDPQKRAEQLNAAINKELKKLLSTPDGRKTFTRSEIAGRLAAAHTHGETFKNRVTQHFRRTTWGSKITKRLNTLDKQLTETYGKPYLTAKKYTKLISKVGLEVAKGSAQFAVAGLVNPVGVPALIAYRTYKQWKTIGPMLKDPSVSKGKKAALLLTGGVSTGLGMITGASGLSEILQATGGDNPAVVQQLINAGNTLGAFGRTIIITAMTSVPNRIEHYLLNRKNKKLSKELEEVSNNHGRPSAEKVNAFNEKKANLQEQINAVTENIKRGGSFKNIAFNFLGINERKLAKLNKKMQQLKTQKPKTIEEIIKAQQDIKLQKDMANQQLIAGLVGTATGVGLSQSGLMPNLVSTLEHNTTGAIEQVTGVSTTDISNAVSNPNEVNSYSPAESGNANTVDNLAAAKAENSSGIDGTSALDHAKYHLQTLDDSRLDAAQTAEKMSAQLGNKANIGVMACKFAPYALQDVLQLDLPEGETPTTHNMIKYISEHGIPADKMAAFNDFADKNFDGARFKTENFPNDYPQHTAATNSHTGAARQPQETQAVSRTSGSTSANVHGSGFRFEPITQDAPEHQPTENKATTEHPATTHTTHTTYQTDDSTYANMPPRVQQWMDQHNVTKMTIAPLELQNGLDHNKYSIAYQAYKEEVIYRYGQAITRIVPAEIVCVPHNPNEKPYIYTNYDSARESMSHHIGAMSGRGLLGSGVITHNNTISKVIAAVNTASHVAHTAHILTGGRL